MKKLSVKLRVTLWFAILMLGSAAIVMAILLGIGEHLVVTATKNDLMTTVENARGSIEYDEGILDFDDDLKYFGNGVSLSVFNEKNQLLYGRSPEGFSTDTPFDHGKIRLTGTAPLRWYVYDMMYHQEGYGAIWMHGVLSADASNATIFTLIRLSVVLLPVLTLLAAGGAFLIAKKAFQPVREITETAEKISKDKNLERRIGLGEGTDEIYTLAATFDHMFDSLQAAFEMERQFTSDVSHELRTPTSVMIAECEYALGNSQISPETRESFESILVQAKHISALVKHFLALARAEQGEFQKEPVNFSELAELVTEQIGELAEGYGIEVNSKIEPDLFVCGDESLLTRLLWNLMENGVKYGIRGGHVTLSLYSEGEKLIGSVEDDGIGIANEHLVKVWNRFYRADSSRSSKGFGLGLPMCKYIAEAHGGEISLKSMLNQGSTFTWSLPKGCRA